MFPPLPVTGVLYMCDSSLFVFPFAFVLSVLLRGVPPPLLLVFFLSSFSSLGSVSPSPHLRFSFYGLFFFQYEPPPFSPVRFPPRFFFFCWFLPPPRAPCALLFFAGFFYTSLTVQVGPQPLFLFSRTGETPSLFFLPTRFFLGFSRTLPTKKTFPLISSANPPCLRLCRLRALTTFFFLDFAVVLLPEDVFFY